MAGDSKEKISAKDANRYLKDVERTLKDNDDLSSDVRQRIESLSNDLKKSISEKNSSSIYKRYIALKALVNEHLHINEKSAFREYFESIGLAILVALFIRGFVFEAFKIPSGSMIPTLEIGDRLFVNKFVYGIRVPFTDRYLVHFAKPKSGEVVVFTFPNEEAKAYLAKQPHSLSACIDPASLNEERDFIKRIVGVEGDTVELRNNHLFVNGIALKHRKLTSKKSEESKHMTDSDYIYPMAKEREINNNQIYTIQYAGRDPNFGPVKVLDGHVFVMGDNRDNSADSRCWGQVPVENIKGRAMFIWLSMGNHGIDFGRFGHSVHEAVSN